ncbi:MAG: potassium transporter TrkH [Lachnospiraceae bacterium]|nr:potassium transporter TrkH [Lachnospiraceae bacterium]
MKPIRIKPVQFIPVSFLAAILAGTLLLMLPFATVSGGDTSPLTAAFTATTSVCVTGLVVVDTYANWSFFGQLIILLLIQIGGLGVVAVGAMVLLIGRKKFTLTDRQLLGNSLNVDKTRGLLLFLRRIFHGVFVVELTGAVLYSIKLIPLLGLKKGIWASLFQSVSAFCNAGMDVIGPNSMMDFQGSWYMMGITMALIVLGGLGFVVWFDIIDSIKKGIQKKRPPAMVFDHLPVHSKLVLCMTGILLLAGTLIVLAAEYHNPDTMGNMPLGEKILNSLFQSVTFRTAGFASVPQDKLTEVSCLAGYILMFIGGSPVGTAGGVKTVTAFLVLMNAFSYINRKENVIFHRRVSEELMRKAAAVVSVSFIAVFIMSVLLTVTDQLPLTNVIYEVVSALATVGLSRGVTPHLSLAGRIIIILSMYLGRIGPISMAFFFTRNTKTENKIRHAEGTFYVG